MYTKDELIEIEKLFQGVVATCKGAKKEKNLLRLRKAYDFAVQAHINDRRKSGEPYIIHPINVARICTEELGLGTTSAVCAMLHDIVEDTDYTLEDIERMFDKKTAVIIDGLTKIPKDFVEQSNSTGEKETISLQAENFRKLLLTISDDIRVILVKLADRMHNMYTLDAMPRNNQLKTAGETLYLYAPLAHRMGLYSVKTQLENLSLKYRHPEVYKEIEMKINKDEIKRQMFINKFSMPIMHLLEQNQIEFNIDGRPKSIFSTWNKMQKKGVSFEEVYDLLAIRIIFKPSVPDDKQIEKDECWKIYSLITQIYEHKPDRVRDWIEKPKSNGYEALHGTVKGPKGNWVEVQIRSEKMNEIAERGIAAHHKYKNSASKVSELDKFMTRVKQHLVSPEENALEFLDDFRLTFLSPEILVFTHKGHLKKLPKDSTVLDFAYEIHSELGNRCIGAKVNKRLVSRSHVLGSGDKVEILASKNQKPSVDWLDITITSKARKALRVHLKMEQKGAIEYGKHKFKEIFDSLHLNNYSQVVDNCYHALDCANDEEMFIKISEEEVSEEDLKILMKKKKNVINYWELEISNNQKSNETENKKTFNNKESLVVTSEQLDDTVKLAKCCNPIPGDQVIGYHSPTGEIIIHQTKCSMAIKLSAQYGNFVVDAQWKSNKREAFLARITLSGKDRLAVVHEITGVISRQMNISIKSIHFQTDEDRFNGGVQVYVYDTDDLQKLIRNLQNVAGVDDIKREDQVDDIIPLI